MKRRTFLKTLGYTAAAGTGLAAYAWQVEPFWLEFTQVDMPVKTLPPALEGKKLMQISDIHVGRRFDHRFLINSFAKAKEHHPDIVVYTGDYVTPHKDEVEWTKLEETFLHLVKGRLATLAILGNHDYGRNWNQPEVTAKIVRLLQENGVTVLRNDVADVQGLQVLGFDDFWGTNFRPDVLMKQYDAARPAIALCHNPDVCDEPVWNSYEGWILAGHTHGGQVKPPFLPPPVLPVKNHRYTAGRFELPGNRTLYINRALGSIWQVRCNVRPEITIFTMRAG